LRDADKSGKVISEDDCDFFDNRPKDEYQKTLEAMMKINTSHPLRFGIITIQNLAWQTLVEHWKLIESLGYDSAWVGDHFVNSQNVEDNWFDGWMLLAALATQTSTIQIGPLVTNIIFRNPALIARQAQTLDHISNGRLALGIGATSERDPSHRMTGVESWSKAERVQRFRETVEIVDQLLRQDTTTYQGRYYQVTDARMRPPTIQKPRPALVLAAAGRTALKVVAEYADNWNTYGGWNLSAQQALEAIRQQSEQLDEYCAKIGRDPGKITHSFLAGLTADTPFASLDAFHDFIGRYREIGISEFIFYYDYSPLPADRCMNREMLERIATEAIPAIRAKNAD
jgi:alkanesulfonate monooxygenase SsuD/methylene tetrahydromethanopterin reductase-like flavin-dependent oxidoreductase (luciferase family)